MFKERTTSANLFKVWITAYCGWEGERGKNEDTWSDKLRLCCKCYLNAISYLKSFSAISFPPRSLPVQAIPGMQVPKTCRQCNITGHIAFRNWLKFLNLDVSTSLLNQLLNLKLYLLTQKSPFPFVTICLNFWWQCKMSWTKWLCKYLSEEVARYLGIFFSSQSFKQCHL